MTRPNTGSKVAPSGAAATMSDSPTTREDRVSPTLPGGGRGIVNSAHLVSTKSPELSEFEFGLIIAAHGFQRWMTRCMAAAGIGDLGQLDVLVLHTVNHRARLKKLADICFVLNIEDSHTVAYSLKKLQKGGLVSTARKGKEALYATTPAGEAACLAYRDVRERCLIDSLHSLGLSNQEIGDLAQRLRALSGLYDQAARAATSL